MADSANTNSPVLWTKKTLSLEILCGAFFLVCVWETIPKVTEATDLTRGRQSEGECPSRLTVALPTNPPALSRCRLNFRVLLGFTKVITLAFRKRTTPLGESLLAMVTLAIR